MKLLQYEDMPRWYSLFWDFSNSGLYIKIHTFFLEHLEHKNWQPYFNDVETRFNYESLFESYEPNIGKERFGINDSITLFKSESDWLTYKISLPTVKFFTGMTCHKCDGTGRRYPEENDCEDLCMFCRGTKKEMVYSYRELRRVCFSLKVLLQCLSIQPKIDMPTHEFQLFTIGCSTGIGLHSHSVSGHMSPTAVKFLETFSDSYEKQIHLPKIEKAMFSAHEQIHGEVRDYDKYSLRSNTKGGQIVFCCPGNACFIDTEFRHRPGDGKGCNISSHNLDDPVQQMTLLSGLAALSTMYDEQK